MFALFRRYRAWLARQRALPEVLVHDGGFQLRRHDRATEVRWSDVAEIATFKEDHGCVDDVRLAFELSCSPPETIVVSEDFPGFEGLCRAVEARFLGVPPEWRARVTMPPFERNYAVLWSHPDG